MGNLKEALAGSLIVSGLPPAPDNGYFVFEKNPHGDRQYFPYRVRLVVGDDEFYGTTSRTDDEHIVCAARQTLINYNHARRFALIERGPVALFAKEVNTNEGN